MSFGKLDYILQKALFRLDGELLNENIRLDLLLGGASAMRLLGIIPRDSRDLDNLRRIEDGVKRTIAKIAEELDMEQDWLNDQASDIPLPDGAENRIELLHTNLRNIRISCLSRQDLICMKVNAAVNRNEPRDIQDLRDSALSVDEFEVAVKYVVGKQRPDDPEFQLYQDEDMEILRRELFQK